MPSTATIVAMTSGGHRPIAWPDLQTRAKIRGAMWTRKCNLPYGPRPGQDDNVLAMDYYEWYGPSDRQKMIATYKSPGYRHAVTGPLVDSGYHGNYPAAPNMPTQAEFNHYLDAMEEWHAVQIMPIHFAHVDGMTNPDEMAPLDALYRQPRAQALLPIVVYTGWEPWRYELTNAQWVEWVKRGADVFPNALRLIHLPADDDAPTGGDDESRGVTNAQCWQNVAPYLHGFLSQVGGYVFSGDCTPSESFKQAFAGFIADGHNRFHNGYGGWPTFSAFGPNTPMRFYAGEYASYITFNQNCPESESVMLGDLAMGIGADGYLDGGSVDVTG